MPSTGNSLRSATGAVGAGAVAGTSLVQTAYAKTQNDKHAKAPQPKTAEAADLLPGAVQIARRLIPGQRPLADGIRHLAELRAQQRNWGEAQSLYYEAIAIYDEKLGPGDPEIAPVLRAYANVLKQKGAPKSEVRDVEARAKALLRAKPQG